MLAENVSKTKTQLLITFLHDSLWQLRSVFDGPDFSTRLGDSLNTLRFNLPPDAPWHAFIPAGCQSVTSLSLVSLNKLLSENGLPPVRFMIEPPATFDCVLVPVETDGLNSGYFFFWKADLAPEEVYFLLAHAWGHLALGHLRTGDEFSHWDILPDLRHPSGPVRRWDIAVQEWLHQWYTPLASVDIATTTDESTMIVPQWELHGWAEAFERLGNGQLDNPALAALAAARRYTANLLQVDFNLAREAGLFPHQWRGAVELAARLQRLGVVLLADSVGLGKTRTTATLIRLLRQNALIRQAAILIPQKLEHNWRTELAQLHLKIGVPGDAQADVVLVNKDKFKRLDGAQARTEVRFSDLLIIEEAHQDLRNSATKFHRNLREAASGRYGLLVTATPWNNRRGDIFSMLYPFASGTLGTERPADAWTCFSKSLKDGQREFETDNELFRQIYSLTALQRTRRQLRESGENSVFYAPRRPHLINVPYEPAQITAFAVLLDKIQELRLPHVNFMGYLADDDNESHLSGFQRFSLLKRAESSMYAFNLSLNTLASKAEALLRELQGVEETQTAVSEWLRRRCRLAQTTQEELNHETNQDVAQLLQPNQRIIKLIEKAEQEQRVLALRYLLIRDCAHDLQIIHSIQAEFKSLLLKDPKLEAILAQVNGALAAGHKILCISQYSDTAWSVYQHLCGQPLLLQKGVGLVTGGKRNGINLVQINGQPTTREEVLSRFAPTSWASKERNRTKLDPNLPSNIDIVVGSDTLSVGQNLQDARVLINLDLCWNPMQHEQRIGRIDRPRHASDSAPLDIYYFLNLELIESELRLQATIERRLSATYQDTEFDDEVLPGYFEMIEQFRRLRQEESADRTLVPKANEVLEEITERSAHPPQVELPNSELEREALLELQAFADHYDGPVPPDDLDQRLLVSVGPVSLYNRQGVLRPNPPRLALLAELEFMSRDDNGQAVGEPIYRHCYVVLHQPSENAASEKWQISLNVEQIAPIAEGLLNLGQSSGGKVNTNQLIALLERLQEYAQQELNFQQTALKKTRRLSRSVEVAARNVTVRLINLKCLSW